MYKTQQSVTSGKNMMRNDSLEGTGDYRVDVLSKMYASCDTMPCSRDKLTAVIKTINHINQNPDEQEQLFPPIVTAPTIPEYVIIDRDQNEELEEVEDGNLTIDPLIHQVINLSDSVLTDLFAVKQGLCGQKFEVKINNIRFVGHPIVITNSSELITLNIVFALKASSSHDIVNCYHEVSHRLTIALLTEESRSGYLSNETANMLKLHRFEEHHDNFDEEYDNEVASINFSTIPENPDGTTMEISKKCFKIECLNNILKESKLAITLKQVFDDITISGTTSVLINNSSLISSCLPQKVHQLLRGNQICRSRSLPPIGPFEIRKALELLRPFHGILLLSDYSKLLDPKVNLTSIPPVIGGDAKSNQFAVGDSKREPTSDTIKVVTRIRPTRTLDDLSKETGLSLGKIFHVVSSLVYWGKGCIIYPICLTNVYCVHPLANSCISSKMIQEFSNQFGSDRNLLHFLSLLDHGVRVKTLQKVTGFSNNLLVSKSLF